MYQKVKAIRLKDQENLYLLILPPERVSYLIDNELVVNGDFSKTKEVQVNNVDNIRIISTNEIVEYYTDGKNNLTLNEYNNKLAKLGEFEINRDDDDDYNDYVKKEDEETLEKRLNLVKFKNTWQPVKKVIQKYSDPILVEVEDSVIETGNKYIIPIWKGDVTTSEISLCFYNRLNALKSIIVEMGNKYNLVFEEPIKEDDDNIKFKYLKVCKIGDFKASGYLITNTEYENIFSYTDCSRIVVRDTLEKSKEMYKRDYNNIERIVKIFISKYNFNLDVDSYHSLLKRLNEIYNRVGDITPVKASNFKRVDSLRLIRSLIVDLEEKLLKLEEKKS